MSYVIINDEARPQVEIEPLIVTGTNADTKDDVPLIKRPLRIVLVSIAIVLAVGINIVGIPFFIFSIIGAIGVGSSILIIMCPLFTLWVSVSPSLYFFITLGVKTYLSSAMEFLILAATWAPVIVDGIILALVHPRLGNIALAFYDPMIFVIVARVVAAIAITVLRMIKFNRNRELANHPSCL